jgi:hypothetical protein
MERAMLNKMLCAEITNYNVMASASTHRPEHAIANLLK